MKIKSYRSISWAKTLTLTLALTILATACDKDGNTIYTPGPDPTELQGNAGDIELDFNHLDALVMTIFWDANGSLTTSDPLVAAPSDAVVNVIQMSADTEFGNAVETSMAKGTTYKQFTCSELNNICGRVGLEGGVKSPLYVRIKSVIGSNVEPKYSNVLTFNVTPYVIDMTIGKFLNKSMEDTGRELYSANSDGIYKGFIGAASWENWYMAEGNGVVWGNENVNWKPFALGSSTDGTNGNMWYPANAGCYYTIVDTQAKEWSALWLTSITVGGDIKGEMAYDRKANAWTLPINATPGTVNITLSASAKLYDVSTGDKDETAIDKKAAFSGDASALEFEVADSPNTIAVTIDKAGQTNLTLDLSDPRNWTIGLGEGQTEQPDPISKYLYMPGIDDGIRGSWSYDSYLINYQEDVKVYGGAVDVNSKWGWVVMEKPEWDSDCGYGYEEGDAYSGKLNRNTSSNIPIADAGQYVVEISLVELTYKLTKIESVSYAGLNDDWSLQPMTRVKGVQYQAQVEKTADTPWGVKIIINENWDIYFGGRNTPGELRLYAEGFEGDNELPNGTYILTVDLTTGKYSYTPAN